MRYLRQIFLSRNESNTRNGFPISKYPEKEVLHDFVGEIAKKLGFRSGTRRPSWIFVDNSKTQGGISWDFFFSTKDMVPEMCAKFQLWHNFFDLWVNLTLNLVDYIWECPTPGVASSWMITMIARYASYQPQCITRQVRKQGVSEWVGQALRHHAATKAIIADVRPTRTKSPGPICWWQRPNWPLPSAERSQWLCPCHQPQCITRQASRLQEKCSPGQCLKPCELISQVTWQSCLRSSLDNNNWYCQ